MVAWELSTVRFYTVMNINLTETILEEILVVEWLC